MPIRLQCPQCRKALSVDQQYAGRSLRCPGCSAAVKVPLPATTSAFTPATPAPTMEFAFDAPTTTHENAAPPLPEGVRDAWHTTAAGLKTVWLGTALQALSAFIFLLLVIALVFTAGNVSALLARLIDAAAGGNPAESTEGFRSFADAKKDSGYLLIAVLVVLGFIALGALFGIYLRVLGFARCLAVPSGGAKVFVLVAFLCEVAIVAGQGVAIGSSFTSNSIGNIGGAVANLASFVGLLSLLLFLRQVGVALHSPLIPGKVLRYFLTLLGGVIAIALGIGLIFLLFVTGMAENGAMNLGIGIAFLGTVFAVSLTLLILYLLLLTATADEIRKRGFRAGGG